MSIEIDARRELDEIFEEYRTGINRWKYIRYAKVIAVLMEYNEPWSYKRFLWKRDEKKGWWVGTNIWLQFKNKILSVHASSDQRNVMNYFHDVVIDYKPRDINVVAETYRALAEWKVEKIDSYTWITVSSSLRTGIYSALKGAKINTLIDVLWFGSDPQIDVPKIRNIWSKKYKILMEIVNAFAPNNTYNISTWEIELFKKIIWVS